MQFASSPWITAGVALVGTSTIAAIPVARPLPDLLDLQSRAVELTAGEESILTPWMDAFNEASVGASQLADNFFLAPGVGLQQAIVNQVTYLGQVIDGTTSVADAIEKIGANASNVLTGITGIDATSSIASTVQDHTLDFLHTEIASLIPSQLPASEAGTVEAIINVLSSPASGMLIGDLGPIISPGVGLLNGVEALVADPTLTNLLALPADVVGGFFNGATLNLDALVPLIGESGILPAGTEIDGLSYAFGGLLSAGSVESGYDFYNSSGDVVSSVNGAGGSMLNSLGLIVSTTFDGIPIKDLSIPGEPVGPLSSLEGLSQAVSALLGSNWDGKNSVPIPPLSGLTFPTLPSDSGSAAAALSTDWLNALNVDDIGGADLLASLNPGDLAALPEQIINALVGLF